MVYTRCLDGDLILRLGHGELMQAQKAGLCLNYAGGNPVAELNNMAIKRELYENETSAKLPKSLAYRYTVWR